MRHFPRKNTVIHKTKMVRMKVIAFIEEFAVIRKILKHLDLWEDQEPRPPPAREET